MPFGSWTRLGPRKSVMWGCTLEQPGKYDWTVHVRRPCKMAELIETPFRVWTRWAQGTVYYTGVQIAPCKGAIFRGKDMPGHARRHCHGSTDQDAVWVVDSGGPKEALGGVHTGATWRIPMNHHVRPRYGLFIKLLWPLVQFYTGAKLSCLVTGIRVWTACLESLHSCALWL